MGTVVRLLGLSRPTGSLPARVEARELPGNGSETQTERRDEARRCNGHRDNCDSTCGYVEEEQQDGLRDSLNPSQEQHCLFRIVSCVGFPIGTTRRKLCIYLFES